MTWVKIHKTDLTALLSHEQVCGFDWGPCATELAEVGYLFLHFDDISSPNRDEGLKRPRCADIAYYPEKVTQIADCMATHKWLWSKLNDIPHTLADMWIEDDEGALKKELQRTAAKEQRPLSSDQASLHLGDWRPLMTSREQEQIPFYNGLWQSMHGTPADDDINATFQVVCN